MSKDAIMKIKDAEEKALSVKKAAKDTQKEYEAASVAEGEAILQNAKENGEKAIALAKSDADKLILRKSADADNNAENAKSTVKAKYEGNIEKAADFIVRSVTG